jgi:hypothetical protein
MPIGRLQIVLCSHGLSDSDPATNQGLFVDFRRRRHAPERLIFANFLQSAIGRIIIKIRHLCGDRRIWGKLMVATTRTLKRAVTICSFVLLIGATAEAGILAVHPFAYNDGNGPAGGAWRGTASFANGDLAGTVDWAVFTANAFNVAFGGGGYVAPAGELVYAHQIFTTDTIPPIVGSSGMSITLNGNPAGNGGSFSAGGVTGVAAFAAFADPSLADWTLVTETDALTPSEGLVYSSPNRPELTGIPILVDGGISAATSLPVGIPGPNPIPEPTTWIMAFVATVLLLVDRRDRRS